MKWLVGGLFVLAALGAVAGLVSVLLPGADETAKPSVRCAVDPTDFAFESCPVGETELSIRITNNGDVPCRIIGFTNVCGNNSCLGAIDADSITIEPHATIALGIKMKIIDPGPFDTSTSLFLDEGGTRTVSIRVHGTAVPAGPE